MPRDDLDGKAEGREHFAASVARAATETCATCGQPLTVRGSGGECLRCLADFGLSPESPLATDGRRASARSTPGPLRYAHFEIETGADGFPVELGAGAMAVTYRARDTVLDSIVALKVIDQTLAQNPAARARFLREARAAAQLHHPNVAAVTHYGEQDGECFYVMELVQGETLEARVRREGPMPLALAIDVVEQGARALAAAEECGIVHRDIKPSNVMIASRQGERGPTDSLLVKVIDYGVAKLVAPEAQIGAEQTHGGFVGTPAFASPEQVAGSLDVRVDTRSDIYSLGMTFWYLLCGRVPFVGRTLEEMRARQLGEPPIEQLKAAHVPSQVIALLKSMVASDPAGRPQSARELLNQLRPCHERFHPKAAWRRRRSRLLLLSAAVLFASAALGSWWYRSVLSSRDAARSIAVLPFENLSPDRTDAFFALGMQDEITADLARLAELKVIGSQSTRSYAAGHERNLPVVSRELRARYLLEGSVSRAAGTMRIALRLSDVRDPSHPWSVVFDRPLGDVFTVQSEITRAIAGRLHARPSEKESARLDTPPTTDLQAYDLYLRARALPRLFRNPAEQRRAAQARIRLLDEATMRAPTFVLAYCDLANAHDVLYQTRVGASQEDPAIDHRARAEVALEKARRLEPDAGQVHLALAEHLFSATQDNEQAAIELDLARQSLPNNADLESTAGTIARVRGHWEEALRCFEKAAALEPRAPVHLFTLANTHRLLRHYDVFDTVMAEVIAIMPAKEAVTYRLFRTFGPLESRGDPAPLRAALAAVPEQDDPHGSSRDLYGLLLELGAHDPEAVLRVLARSDQTQFLINRVAYPKGWFEALAARMRGDEAAARAAFMEARLAVEQATVAEPADNRELSVLAVIDAGLGRKEVAIREAKRACDLAPWDGNAIDAPIVRCNLAVVYAWTGETDLALAELEDIVGRPAGWNVPAQPTYGDFKLNPLWDPLRGDARFAAIAERLAPVGIR